MAASSVGKLPRVLITLRKLRCRLSTALVTGMKIAVPGSFGWDRQGSGVWCDHPGRGAPGARKVGRPIYTMS
jgi:hypothetical protein